MSRTVLFQIIQFSISTQFKCKYGLIVKNHSISSYSVSSNTSPSFCLVSYPVFYSPNRQCLVIIIIIMSFRQHGYPWASLATFPYRSSPLAGLQGYIPYPHIASVCMFELVVLLLLGHMWGSMDPHIRRMECLVKIKKKQKRNKKKKDKQKR